MRPAARPIPKLRSQSWPYEADHRPGALPPVERSRLGLKRIKGSHYIFGKSGEWKILSVPVHGNQIIKPGLAARIASRGSR